MELDNNITFNVEGRNGNKVEFLLSQRELDPREPHFIAGATVKSISAVYNHLHSSIKTISRVARTKPII